VSREETENCIIIKPNISSTTIDLDKAFSDNGILVNGSFGGPIVYIFNEGASDEDLEGIPEYLHDKIQSMLYIKRSDDGHIIRHGVKIRKRLHELFTKIMWMWNIPRRWYELLQSLWLTANRRI
jgi:hypothetical protein